MISKKRILTMSFSFTQADIEAYGSTRQDLDTIFQRPFFDADPTIAILHTMVGRGVGSCCLNDRATALVLSRLEDFGDRISKPETWKTLAVHYFHSLPNRDKVNACFERSLQQDEFKSHLEKALALWDKAKERKEPSSFLGVESAVRLPLTIFHQSMKLKIYTYPKEATLEKASISTVSQNIIAGSDTDSDTQDEPYKSKLRAATQGDLDNLLSLKQQPLNILSKKKREETPAKASLELQNFIKKQKLIQGSNIEESTLSETKPK